MTWKELQKISKSEQRKRETRYYRLSDWTWISSLILLRIACKHHNNDLDSKIDATHHPRRSSMSAQNFQALASSTAYYLHCMITTAYPNLKELGLTKDML
jgi:hypothetical protein